LEEELEVLLRKLPERRSVAADGALENQPLLVLQAEYALLDCVAHNEAHGADRLMLAEAVRSVNRLVLGSRVPPRVHEIDVGGNGQVERDAARLGWG
jgi:hypothetical protein